MLRHRSLLALGSLIALLTGCSAPDLAVSADRKHQGDYLPAHRLQLVIDGKVAGTFHDIQGLDAPALTGGDVDRDGSMDVARKHVGRPSYGSFTLKRGMVSDSSLLDWYVRGGGDCDDTGSCQRKSGSIIYLDRAGQEVLRLNFYQAWPTRYEAPPYNARTATHVVEEIELVAEKVER